MSWRVVQGLKPDNALISKKITDLATHARNEAKKHFVRGVDLYHKNSVRRARKEFLMALLHDPDHEPALFYLKQKLTGPDFLVYVTRGGETPGGVAREMYKDTDKAFIVAYFNGLNENHRLKQGVTLRLPKIEMPSSMVREVYTEDKLGEARALYKRRHYREAITSAGVILKKDPENSEAGALRTDSYYQLGIELFRKKDFKGAGTILKNLDPDYRDVRVMVSRLREEAEAHYRKGVDHFIAEELEGASREFKKALQLNPDHPKAKKDLERTQGLLENLRRLK